MSVTPPARISPRVRRRLARPAGRMGSLLALTTAALLGLVGCTGAGSGSASSAGAADSGAATSAVRAAPGEQASSGLRGQGSTAKRPPSANGGFVAAGVPRQIARSASLSMQVRDVGRAAADIRGAVKGLRGTVLNEQLGDGGGMVKDGVVPQDLSGSSQQYGGYATMTLSVPAAALDQALTVLSRLGTVTTQSLSSEDVTGQVVDTQSRVRTMRASLDRVRTLMARAKDVGQVVLLETQLSKREADLESLQAQLAAVQGSVAQSTITLSLSTPALAKAQVADTGFVAGLRAGWHAFETSVTGVLTAVGAVLPFAAVLALVGVPAYLWWRRRSPVGSLATSVGAEGQPGT